MLKISNHHISKVVIALLGMEVFILLVAGYLSIYLRLIDQHDWYNHFSEFLPSACIFALAIVTGMSAMGMYQRNLIEGLRLTFLRLMPAFVIGLCILGVIFFMAPDLPVGRGILILDFLFAGLGILLVRNLFFKIMQSRVFVSRIIFLGAGDLVKECIKTAQHNINNHKYYIVGAIPVQGEDSCLVSDTLIRVDESLLATANRFNAREIVVAVRNRRAGSIRLAELLECKLNGVHVMDAVTFFEREECHIRLDCLQLSWLVFGRGFDQGFIRTFIKRSFDLCISALILPVVIPVMLLTALCIYAEDKAPIFYRQERVGKNGRHFMVLKFRSMRSDAEAVGKPQWATSNDPRTTRVGAVMRKFRIDELPQVLNVFKGEMSFVGPRPERPFFVDQLSKEIRFYNIRHSIKPGITGWAQVRYQYGSSIEDAIQKQQYDLYYVKNNSLFLDILILIDTLRVVLFGSGT
jgi:sugar transferase (PEP-CTERM system associated)